MAQTINKEEAKRNRKERLEAYVAAAHLRFAPAGPPWRPCVRGMRQNCSGANILATSGIFLYINASCPGPSDARRCRRSLSLLAVAFQHVVCVLVWGHGHGAVPGFRLRASALRPT